MEARTRFAGGRATSGYDRLEIISSLGEELRKNRGVELPFREERD